MRISLPPRPGVAPGAAAKPAGAATTVPTAGVAPKPGVPSVGAASAAPQASPGTSGTRAGVAPGAGGLKPASSSGPAVRTVVDTDGASTALAIAALVASLISFGVVLLSFLQK
ncbi:MAG: hypothetical protein EBT57_03875 [Verrucomicrobia bacterium]|nr:hypothetical protein [Verrucomicrobiota bacterium]